jgi:hypothetical protein
MDTRYLLTSKCIWCFCWIVGTPAHTASFAFVPPLSAAQQPPRLLAASSNTVSIPERFSRSDAIKILEDELLPRGDYGRRIKLGRLAQGMDNNSDDSDNSNRKNGAVSFLRADDPSLAQTYGEFPLSSLDTLIDRALGHCRERNAGGRLGPWHFVDIGSGCGRLCAYTALTRGGTDGVSWNIHGIELAPLLHQEAVSVQQRSVERGYARVDTMRDGLDLHQGNHNVWQLHQGPVLDFVQTPVMRNAQLLFCYSTTWTTSPPVTSMLFQEGGLHANSLGVGSLILSHEWCQWLEEACPVPGTIVITTDRALDPRFGWKIIDRIDVPNPEVWESTCYIHTRVLPSKD